MNKVCCGVQTPLPPKNGLIQAHKETKLKLAKNIIDYWLYTVFPNLYIYSKNKYLLSHVYL